MTARERRLLLIVTVGGVLFAGYAAYAMVWSPIAASREQDSELEAKLAEKTARLTKLQKDRKRLEDARKRSLPGNTDDARREYEAAMRQLLRDAGVPAGWTISKKENSNAQTIPELEPKKPAYARIGYSIQMKRVNLPTVAKFLEGYYGLNVLHRITEFDLKKDDASSSDTPKQGAKFDPLLGRDNLEVTLVTEAIILDGAELRKSLLTVPMGFAAVGGGAGQQAVSQTPDVGRGLVPINRVQVLAANRRDYFLLAAKDAFHGPLPEYPPIARGPVIPPKPLEQKDDISEHVKLVDITRRSDGTATAFVRDQLNNRDYQIDMTPRAERLEVAVKKYLYEDGERKTAKPLADMKLSDPWTLTYLAIQEPDASTIRSFKVVGIEADGLVLVETVELNPKADAPREPSRSGRNGPPRRELPKLEPIQLPAAVIGGVGVVTPKPKPVTEDRVFVWRVGMTLDTLRPLGKDAGREQLQKTGYVPPSFSKVD